jgi:hypothetical protein
MSLHCSLETAAKKVNTEAGDLKISHVATFVINSTWSSYMFMITLQMVSSVPI